MESQAQKIGLFGGSFNPVQNAHLMIARLALEQFNLDKIFFIPAAQSPFKPDIKPAAGEQRLRLLRLALASEPKFAVDDQEIKRGGVSYTIDTVRNYKEKYPTAALFYIIGADHLSSLPKWKNAETLATMADFIVFTRPNEKVIQLPQIYKIHLIDGFYFSISSTLIRERICKGLSIKGFVPDTVAEIIQRDHLFMENNSQDFLPENKQDELSTTNSINNSTHHEDFHKNFNSCSHNSAININNRHKNEK